MGGNKPPPPTREERGAQQAQTDLLNLQRQQLEAQQRQQEMLAPVLYKQVGLEPQIDPATGQVTGYTTFQTPEQQLYQEQLRVAQRQQAEQERLQPLLWEQAGLVPQRNEAGEITGFGYTPEAELRRALETQLLERQEKALRGELPVDPTLERALSEGEQRLRQTMQQQLGTGWETSTPGQQALQEYGKRAAEARYSVSHGEMSSAGQLALQREQANLGRFGLAQSGRLQLQDPALMGLAQQASPYALAQGYQAAVQAPFGGTLGQFGQLAQQYGGLAGGYAKQRGVQYAMDQQAQQQRGQQYGMYGALGGAAIGGVLGGIGTFGFGAPAGAAAGASLGSAAGSMYGYRTY
jgi:hypothetical protein